LIGSLMKVFLVKKPQSYEITPFQKILSG